MKAAKIRPEKYQLSYLYPMGSGMQLVFLDPSTILFGDKRGHQRRDRRARQRR